MFRCKELTVCFANNELVRENGTFTLTRKKRRRLKPVKLSKGWLVGQNSLYFANGDRYKGEYINGRGKYEFEHSWDIFNCFVF